MEQWPKTTLAKFHKHQIELWIFDIFLILQVKEMSIDCNKSDQNEKWK